MPTLEKNDAAARLIQALKEFKRDDLIAAYDEVFPEATDAGKSDDELLAAVVGRLENGIDLEEIVDLWNVVFPGHHGVTFDEEKSRMHYSDSELELTD